MANFLSQIQKDPLKIKQILQESDLPPWEREFFPLIFISEKLASVPNFGVDIKFQTKLKEVGLEVIFQDPQ